MNLGTVIDLAAKRPETTDHPTCEVCGTSIQSVEPLLSLNQTKTLIDLGELTWDTPTYVVAKPCNHVLPKPDRRFYANQ